MTQRRVNGYDARHIHLIYWFILLPLHLTLANTHPFLDIPPHNSYSEPLGGAYVQTTGLEADRPDTPIETSLTWVDHPARQSPAKLALTTAVFLVSTLALLPLEGGVVLALVALAVLTFATAPFLLPTRFTLGAEGISRRSLVGTQRRTWETLRRWQEDRHGILVSPYRASTQLDDVRGIYLRGGPKEQIRQVLFQRLGPPTPLPGK